MQKILVIREKNSVKTFDYTFQTRTFFTVCGYGYTIKLSGGSIVVCDGDGNKLSSRKGFNYLYTADIRPDAKQVFALENGKHFYVFDLPHLSRGRRITLPRGMECIDLYGKYSEDGTRLFVPAMRYGTRSYDYFLCEYETQDYTLCGVKKTKRLCPWPSPRDADG